MTRILLAESDPKLADLLITALAEHYYWVELAQEGEMAWDLTTVNEFDLIIYELMLPKLNGAEFCQRLRDSSSDIPVLLLAPADDRSSPTQELAVQGLDAGADDYIATPFDLPEFLARIRALLRRGDRPTQLVLTWGELKLDPRYRQVTFAGHPLTFTSKEYALIELFLHHPQRIFSQSALIERLWQPEETPTENAVRAHIKSLRQKLKQVGGEALIITIYGLGYRLNPEMGNLQPQSSLPRSQSLKGAPDSAVPSDTVEASLAAELAIAWQQSKAQYSDRVAVLEAAIKAAKDKQLTSTLCQQARLEAHTMVGSLGSFGLSTASKLSRQIEQLFAKAKVTLLPADLQQLTELTRALRRELDKTVALESPVFSIPDWHPETPKLLIVDDDLALAQELAKAAIAWNFQPEVATSLEQARMAIAQTPPQVVLLDLNFPDTAERGFVLLKELSQRQPPIATVVFTAQEDFACRVKVARWGGKSFLQKPISPNQVMETVSQVLQQSEHEAKILIVDDDPQLLDHLRVVLEPWGLHVTLLDDPLQFWSNLKDVQPDLLILNLEMPGWSGIDLCRVVRNDPHWGDLPILFLSAHTDSAIIHQVFLAGADDYVNKPIVSPELVARVLNRLDRYHLLRRRAAQGEN